MKPFMDEEFLLSNDTAKTLYHDYAEKMPIIDYHCHINPAEIAENRKFDNITQVWLSGDHYKWRQIRSNGVDEKYITGDSTDREKFQAFAEMIPKAIGNPLYHWTHLELKRYFDCDIPLSGDTAEEIWNLCNKKLQEDSMSVRSIISKSNVTTINTTDDPIDSLEYHKKIQNDPTFKTTVVPAWRPDKIMNIEKSGFADYLKKLALVSDVDIKSMHDIFSALNKRLDYFFALGCRASDHGMNAAMYAPATDTELDTILEKKLAGKTLTNTDVDQYKYAVLVFLAEQYAKRGWVMEIHVGTTRDTNSVMFEKLGPDAGFDCISSADSVWGLVRFLNELNTKGILPKTILFSLHPGNNAIIDTILGCFQGTEVAGKIQHGAAWWYNDTKAGMIEHMTSLADLSLLGNFLGMLTDSRSFISYTRHEYFRRILCNFIGTLVENGEYPDDRKVLGQMIQDISYNNAMRYFGFMKDASTI